MHPQVRDYLLNYMADDYEDFEMLFSETLRQAKQQGQELNRAETLEAIEQLISQGLAQAYTLSIGDAFILIAWTVVGYLLLMLFLRPNKLSFGILRSMQ